MTHHNEITIWSKPNEEMLGRAWSQPPRTVVVAASGAAKAPRHTLTAMTYNLLADKYARGGYVMDRVLWLWRGRLRSHDVPGPATGEQK